MYSQTAVAAACDLHQHRRCSCIYTISARQSAAPSCPSTSERGNGNSACRLASDLLRAPAPSPSPRSIQCGRSLFCPSEMLAAASQSLAPPPHILRAWRSQSPRSASHRWAHLASTPGLRAARGLVRAAIKDVIHLRAFGLSCLFVHSCRTLSTHAGSLDTTDAFQYQGLTAGRLAKARVGRTVR